MNRKTKKLTKKPVKLARKTKKLTLSQLRSVTGGDCFRNGVLEVDC